jgi:hypothetical protein
MALQAHRNKRGPDLVASLEADYGYLTREPELVGAFLLVHPDLYDALAQAASSLKSFFPKGSRAELEVGKDYESEIDLQNEAFFVIVHVPSTYTDKQYDLLYEFEQRWWDEAAKDSLSARRLTFDVA